MLKNVGPGQPSGGSAGAELDQRPYHHGDLRRALIDAALAEIAEFGPGHMSLRELARRAGVSHAAPAHHFGDKTGVFTAIAAEGFTLLVERTSAAAEGPDPLFGAGMAYIEFALTHPAHFTVMWRPDLYDSTDSSVLAARQRTFRVFFDSVGSVADPNDDRKFSATVLAAWSMVHGFSALWLTGNLSPEFGSDPGELALLAAEGVPAVASAISRVLRATAP